MTINHSPAAAWRRAPAERPLLDGFLPDVLKQVEDDVQIGPSSGRSEGGRSDGTVSKRRSYERSRSIQFDDRQAPLLPHQMWQMTLWMTKLLAALRIGPGVAMEVRPTHHHRVASRRVDR